MESNGTVIAASSHTPQKNQSGLRMPPLAPGALPPFTLSARARAAAEAALSRPSPSPNGAGSATAARVPPGSVKSPSAAAAAASEPSSEAISQLCAKISQLVRGASAAQIRTAVHSASFNLSRAVEALRAEVARAAEERERADREHKRQRKERQEQQRSSQRGSREQIDEAAVTTQPMGGGAPPAAAASMRPLNVSTGPPDDMGGQTLPQPAMSWFQAGQNPPRARKRPAPEPPAPCLPSEPHDADLEEDAEEPLELRPDRDRVVQHQSQCRSGSLGDASSAGSVENAEGVSAARMACDELADTQPDDAAPCTMAAESLPPLPVASPPLLLPPAAPFPAAAPARPTARRFVAVAFDDEEDEENAPPAAVKEPRQQPQAHDGSGHVIVAAGSDTE